jgi:protease-4
MGYLDEQIEKNERRRHRRQRYPLIAVVILVIVLIGALTAFTLYSRERNIVVISVEGDLYTGSGPGGSEYIGQELIDAADDSLVEAIVLRVNSPGGTPAAAQEIVQDIQYARARKPVVASMGDMATSAAYYVCAYTDRIYADPDTITGGLGTIWVFTDISTWMRNEGYSVTVVKSGESKDMTFPYRNLSSEEEQYAQDLVNRSFERFITDITSQRNISRSLVENARLYRGEEAKSMGLVDELGNLHAAIEGARALATARRG